MTTTKPCPPETKSSDTLGAGMAILGTGYLNSDWCVEGKSPEEFFEILKALDSLTKTTKVHVRDLIICSPEKVDRNEYGDEITMFRKFTVPHNTRYDLNRRLLEDSELEYLYDELQREKGNLLWLGGLAPMLFTRPKSVRELLGHLGLAGSAIEDQSYERDNYVSYLIQNAPPRKQLTLVSRIEGDDDCQIEKVLSIRTGKYTPIPLAELENVYNSILEADMGEVKCLGWSVNHDYASIDLIFPDATAEFKELCGLREDVHAGVRLQTSGTGYCCFTAKEIWVVGGVTSEHDSVKNKHIGEWEPEEFLKDVKVNIFDEYAALPERLCELFNIVLVNDDTVDKAPVILNKCITALFKHLRLAEAFKAKVDEEDATKKSYVRELTDKLVDHFLAEIERQKAVGSVEISAYDLAVAVMELPATTTGIPKSYLVNFSNICGKAAYYPFKEGHEYTKTKKPEITIVA